MGRTTSPLHVGQMLYHCVCFPLPCRCNLYNLVNFQYNTNNLVCLNLMIVFILHSNTLFINVISLKSTYVFAITLYVTYTNIPYSYTGIHICVWLHSPPLLVVHSQSISPFLSWRPIHTPLFRHGRLFKVQTIKSFVSGSFITTKLPPYWKTKTCTILTI